MNCFSIFRTDLPIRFVLTIAGLSLGLSTVPITEVQAQTSDGGAFYKAELAQPQESARFAAGGVVWTCAGTSCTAARGDARPLRMCRELKKKTGAITSFTIEGEELAADRLERCNR